MPFQQPPFRNPAPFRADAFTAHRNAEEKKEMALKGSDIRGGRIATASDTELARAAARIAKKSGESAGGVLRSLTRERMEEKRKKAKALMEAEGITMGEALRRIDKEK